MPFSGPFIDAFFLSWYSATSALFALTYSSTSSAVSVLLSPLLAALGAYTGSFALFPSLFCPSVTVVLPVGAAAPFAAVRFGSGLCISTFPGDSPIVVPN